MSTVSSQQFEQICEGVWRDRTSVVTSRGFLSAEAALVRAVYWRLCKAGVTPTATVEKHGAEQTISTYRLIVECVLELNASPPFDGAPFLNDLVARYHCEVGE